MVVLRLRKQVGVISQGRHSFDVDHNQKVESSL